MKKLAEFVWAFFIAATFFGVWIVPLIAIVFVVYCIIYVKWPLFFKKYL